MANERSNPCNWLIPVVVLLLLTLALAKPNSTPLPAYPESLRESCGINMECLPRKLCQDKITKSNAFHITTPKIKQAKCSRVLHRCCSVKPKEDKEDSQP